ncbi:hypothetical protein Chor_012247 [Crotalus horridus]
MPEPGLSDDPVTIMKETRESKDQQLTADVAVAGYVVPEMLLSRWCFLSSQGKSFSLSVCSYLPGPQRDTDDSLLCSDRQTQVALRIRPISMAELEEGATLIAHKVDDQITSPEATKTPHTIYPNPNPFLQMVVLMDPMEDPDDVLRANRSREKSYLFDVAFDFAATQEMVYRATTKGLIEGIISGYNATIFAYGPTGCGKTYTMLGTDHEPGIYVQTLNDLFHAIEETSNDMEYEVSMSYLEIYNEMIRDLLNPSLGYLDLREDAKGFIQVAGITEVSTINAKEIMQLLMKGNKQRTQEPTAANRTSSRSHAVLQVTVRQKSRIKNIMQEVRIGRLFMIDLAGSERASQTQNRGQRMKEGAHINRSLLALGNCINALSDRTGVKYVNYRDSKLTRLLKDSLGGNSRTVMIAHISPASSAFEESRSTLTYAERAKNIRTTVKRNHLNVSYHIAQYTSIIADLHREIHRLQCKIEQQEPRPMRSDIRSIQAEVHLRGNHFERQEMDQLREQLISTFREQMDVRRHLMELENNYMEIQIENSRHLLTIADWEQEKTRRAQKWREEQRKESYNKDENEKDSDTGDELSDVPEPAEVVAAREHTAILLGEQDKLHKQKVSKASGAELERRFWEVQQRGHRLEEALPWCISSEEQREVLSLLCKVHELEVENTAIQSSTLLKDNFIHHQERAVRHFERYRSLCHRIIQEQRQIIHVKWRLSCNGDLAAQKKGSLEPCLSSAVLESADADLSFLNSEAVQVFKASPRARQMKHSAVMTPPPIHVNGMISQEHKEMASGIKNIAVKAARRRSRVLESDRLSLLKPTKELSNLSLHSLSESEDALCRETPALCQPASPSLQHAISEDNLSSSTGDTAPGRHVPRRSLGPWLQVNKKGSKKLEKREESLEAKRRRQRSRSFEVMGQRLQDPKNNASRRHPLESSSEHKIVAAGGMNNIRGIGKTAMQLSRVRLLQVQPSSGPSEASSLSVASHQSGITKKISQPSQYAPRLNYVTVNGTNPPGKDGKNRRC